MAAALTAKLLHDTRFADFTFKCSDGETVRAHKSVIAASSPYFSEMLDTEWKDLIDPVIEVEHSSVVLRNFLSFLYTGEVKENLTAEVAVGLLGLSVQHAQPVLKHKCTDALLHSITDDTLKLLMQASRQYSLIAVGEKCFDYVKNNAFRILVKGPIASLQQDEPELWEELTEYENKCRKTAGRVGDASTAVPFTFGSPPAESPAPPAVPGNPQAIPSAAQPLPLFTMFGGPMPPNKR